MIYGEDYRFYDLYQERAHDTTEQLYSFFKKIISGSEVMETVPNLYIEGDESTNGELLRLMSIKIAKNAQFIEALKAFNEEVAPSLSYVRTIAKYERVGKNFIKEKLKNIDWDNNNQIREYAKIYGFKELEQYDSKKDLTGFTEEQTSEWQTAFQWHLIVLDDKQDIIANTIIHKVEKYRNDNFFHLKGITKNICQLAPYPDMWSKIASYCESPTHQPQELGDQEHEVIVNLLADTVTHFS